MSKLDIIHLIDEINGYIKDGQPWQDRDIKLINRIVATAYQLASMTQRDFGVESDERLLGTKILLDCQSAFQVVLFVRSEVLDRIAANITMLRNKMLT